MPETPNPPKEAREPSPQFDPDLSDYDTQLDIQLDNELMDAFLPDDEYEPLPGRGDFWIEKD